MKLALIIGINYTGQDGALSGCINDAVAMRTFLIDHLGFKSEEITLMTDDSEGRLLPTGRNIMSQLGHLVIDAYHGKAEELWIHYLGHGSYMRDRSGDEDDGKDEVLVPLDHETGGMISDDDLHYYLSHLPSTCKTFCLFDCCHSGTMLDLAYRHKGDGRHEHENPGCSIKGNVVMISGCKDTQTSADAWIEGDWAGAMTSAFLTSMKGLGYETTYFALLDAMRAYLEENEYDQIPQLSSNKKLKVIDIFCAKVTPEPLFISSM